MFSTRIKNLSLTHFRCYPTLKLTFEGRIITFTGPNGAGKTNILEALSFLNPGRGLRRTKLSQAISTFPMSLNAGIGASGWGISSHVCVQEGVCHVGTAFTKTPGEETEKRVVRVDGKDLSSHSELEKMLSIFWLTPAMDRLLGEGASHRRRLIDKFASSLNPEHSKHLYRYEYALRERMRLLREGRYDPLWVSVLEEKMALEGVALTVARQEMIDLLMTSMTAHQKDFPKAILSLEGELEALLETHSALDVEEMFKKNLHDKRDQDRVSGSASMGAHVSDVYITHDAKNIPLGMCSTGEQKVLLVSMILSHLRLHAVRRQETPILLFDEGLVHLDAHRRVALFKEIEALDAQTFFTGTDPSAFSELRTKCQFFDVQEGYVTEIVKK